MGQVLRKFGGLYVQFGCGLCAPSGWMNFESSPTLRFERIPVLGKLYSKNAMRFPANVRYGDILIGLPVADASCSGIYCSHVLEHLALEDIDAALTNTYRYLVTGGIFRLVVPDLGELVRCYVSDNADTASHRFLEASGLGRRRRPRGLFEFIRDWFGNSAHLWMWDERSMAAKLRQHGFLEIRRAVFGDSEDPRFREVEDKDRFEGCLAMQCRK